MLLLLLLLLLMAESGVMIEIVVGKGNEFAQPKKVGSVIVWTTPAQNVV